MRGDYLCRVSEAVLDENKLFTPGSSDDFSLYVRRLFRMRGYAWNSARRGLESENSTTALGQLWLLLQPAITICILWFVFDVMLGVSRGAENYVAFLTVGILVFNHTQRGVLRGAASLVNGAAMLLSFSFPKAVLVLSQVLHAAASYRYSLAVGAIVLPFMGVTPSLSWLWMIPLTAVQITFNFGLAVLLARPATHFSDFRLALEYVFQIIFYISGVFFPATFFLADLENGELLMKIASANPFYGLVELARWALIGTRPDHAGIIIGAVGTTTVLFLAAGLVVFWRGESELSGVKTIKISA